MKKKDKISKKKNTKKEKKLYCWINHIMLTIQRGDKRRTIWIEESEVREWLKKYYSCRRMAKWIAVASVAIFSLADAKTIIALIRGEKIYQNDRVTLKDVIAEELDAGVQFFCVVIVCFLIKSILKMNSTMKKKISEY